MTDEQKHYMVEMEITRRVEVGVSAGSPEEALEKANEMKWDYEYAEGSEIIDWAVLGEAVEDDA